MTTPHQEEETLPVDTESQGTQEVQLPADSVSLDPLLQKDFSKLRDFYIQAVCGPYMAIYRTTGQLPSTAREMNLLQYYLAKYLNDTHLEVVTGQNNDEYIRTIFEDCMTHHSIDCIVNIVFQLGCQMFDQLLRIEIVIPPLESAIDGKPPHIPPEQIDALRNLISTIVESWSPNFADLFNHSCNGQSIIELKAAVQAGRYVPPFNFNGV